MKARARLTIRGAVQGVGFRPFVYRLATGLGLTGWILNSAGGVSIEVEGEARQLDEFLLRVERERPPRAFIQSLESSRLDPAGFTTFEIRESASGERPTALVLPDIATCPDCLRELNDPADRRYQYPFINCTNCGPRFSIIEALPYDRPNTSMRGFAMCAACRREYDDPLDRRFHAQPIACPICGPSVELWDADGRSAARAQAAIEAAVDAVGDGRTVGLKGLGGFQLIVDARNEAAVQRLRDRKHREEKPFALLFPSLQHVETACVVSPLEARLLASPESPIVLLPRRTDSEDDQPAIAGNVAPRHPTLGAMLPYTPLHHLLMQALGHPVVATSGNISDEPICTDEMDALDRLRGIADVFLVHNRPIVRHVDDSIVRVMAGREQVLRRARGYAPLPIALRSPAPPLLAVGAHLKNTIGVTAGTNFFISQHIGDLETAQANEAFRRAIDALLTLYEVEPATVAADLHPDYASTRFARRFGSEIVQVQHHYAHVAACMAENELCGPVLGVAWDGTGYGVDGTVWGGEFLVPRDDGFTRVATLRPFRLPGGERAIQEPRRTAIGVLFEIFGADVARMHDLAPVAAFAQAERDLLVQALGKEINSPVTTSAGRLFDAVSALVGLRQTTSFEGQAAMALEFAVDPSKAEAYPFELDAPGASANGVHLPLTVLDWRPTVLQIVDDVRRGVSTGTIAARFHMTMVEGIVEVARRVGLPRVVLTGGCFQNRFLLEHAIARLQSAEFQVYWHQRVPPNDGGIALGQAVAALRMIG